MVASKVLELIAIFLSTQKVLRGRFVLHKGPWYLALENEGLMDALKVLEYKFPRHMWSV